jgi:hypothetical protein
MDRNADDPEMADFTLHLLELAMPAARAYNAIMSQHHGRPAGIEYEHYKDAGRFACVLPDASAPGKYRVQYFDKNGFSSHDTVGPLDRAVEQMATEGFRLEARGVLHQMSQTKTWSIGCAVTALMQKVNAGVLKWEEFLRERNALYADMESGHV